MNYRDMNEQELLMALEAELESLRNCIYLAEHMSDDCEYEYAGLNLQHLTSHQTVAMAAAAELQRRKEMR